MNTQNKTQVALINSVLRRAKKGRTLSEIVVRSGVSNRQRVSTHLQSLRQKGRIVKAGTRSWIWIS